MQKHTKQYEALAVWTVNRTRAGKVRSVAEYVDMTTGEIIPASDVLMPTIDLRTKASDRLAALQSLRPEVQKFARFVLRFANKRRGITPGISVLCRWYADMTGARLDNVKRSLPKLHAAGILAGENLLGKLFQRSGGTMAHSMGEEGVAVARYALMLAAKRGFPRSENMPAWMADARQTMLTRDTYNALMARLTAPATEAMC